MKQVDRYCIALSSVIVVKVDSTNVVIGRYVQLLVQEMTIKLEVGFLLSLLTVYKFKEPDDSREFELALQKFLKDVESTKVSIISEARQSRLQMQEHQYDYVHLSPIAVFTSYFRLAWALGLTDGKEPSVVRMNQIGSLEVLKSELYPKVKNWK